MSTKNRFEESGYINPRCCHGAAPPSNHLGCHGAAPPSNRIGSHGAAPPSNHLGVLIHNCSVGQYHRKSF